MSRNLACPSTKKLQITTYEKNDGKQKSQEHLVEVNTQMAFIGVVDALKNKNYIKNPKGNIAFLWYMHIPCHSTIKYVNFSRLFIHQISASRHQMVLAAHFNEAIIWVITQIMRSLYECFIMV